MNWQQLKYGTLVAAGIPLIGSLVWFSNRNQVHAVDMIEIFQGFQERCIALCITTGSSSMKTVTVTRVEWDNIDASGMTWFSYTNGPATNQMGTNAFRTISGTSVVTVLTYTNAISGDYLEGPLELSKEYFTETGEKFIWGGWTNYTIEGAALPYLDGTYIFLTNETGRFAFDAFTDIYTTRYIYVNTNDTNYTLVDYGPLQGYKNSIFQTMYSWGIYDNGSLVHSTDPGDTAHFNFWNFGGSPDPSVTVRYHGELRTNKVRDAYVLNSEEQDNTFDALISKAMYMAFSSRIPHLADDDVYHSSQKHAGWIYTNDAPDGDFTGLTNSEPFFTNVTSSALWTQLGLPKATSITFTVHNFFSDQSTNLPVSQFGSYTNLLITTNYLGERYRAMFPLEWTHRGGELVNGRRSPYGTAIQYQKKSARFPDLADAKTDCLNATVTITPLSVYVRPRAESKIENHGGANPWEVTATIIVNTLSPNALPKYSGLGTDLDYYVSVQNVNIATPTRSTYDTLDIVGAPPAEYTNAWWRYVIQTNVIGVAGTNALFPENWQIISNNTWPPRFPVAPTGLNFPNWLGFAVYKEDIVAKWDFQYCTNALP